jgi:isochorismate hydrolase
MDEYLRNYPELAPDTPITKGVKEQAEQDYLKVDETVRFADISYDDRDALEDMLGNVMRRSRQYERAPRARASAGSRRRKTAKKGGKRRKTLRRRV